MAENDPIRVFVTHDFSESDDYLRVFEFLEGDDHFYYLNVSKPEQRPPAGGLNDIKDELIAQIKASEVVVVLPGIYEQHPDLTSYMLDVAEANDIGIIAIRPFGGMGETPKKLVARIGEPISWNARELIDSIKLTARGEDTHRWEVVDFPGFDADGNETKDE